MEIAFAKNVYLCTLSSKLNEEVAFGNNNYFFFVWNVKDYLIFVNIHEKHMGKIVIKEIAQETVYKARQRQVYFEMLGKLALKILNMFKFEWKY